MTMNNNPSGDIEKYVRDLEQKIVYLEDALKRGSTERETFQQYNKELKKANMKLKQKSKKLKRENKKLNEELARLKSSAPVLAGSDKTAEAGGIPSSGTFYKRNRQEGKKKPTGGQPGHRGHARKKPTPNSPPQFITLDKCLECDTPLGKPIDDVEQKRTVTDIPLPDHIVYETIFSRYWCKKCKHLVRGNAPWLPPNQQFGPAVACWIAYQRMLGLSIGKIQSSLFETYALSMGEATILKLEKWVADTLKEDYEKIHNEVVNSHAVNADETSFRINGTNGWLWVFTSTVGSYYKLAPTRGHEVPEKALEGFKGVLGRDAWKPYDVIKCEGHQLDLLHVNRWLERAEIRHSVLPRTLLTSKPVKLKRRGRPPKQLVHFVDGIRSILKRAINYTETDPPPSTAERAKAKRERQEEMELFLAKKWTNVDVVRISKELRRRRNMLFTFMDHEGVPWHNNDAERAIRQGVLHRKISGGRRTWTGAEVLEILLSVYETSKKRSDRFIEMAKAKFNPPTG